MFCFNKNMVNSVSNYDLYMRMRANPQPVGVLDVPNDHHKPVLYSHEHATKEYQQLERDLYQQMKKIERPSKDTPKSVFWVLGIIGSAVAYALFRKKI